MELIDQIKALAKEYKKEVIETRRHLHANPELSFEEYETLEFITNEIKKLEIPYIKGIAKTGLVAFLEGKNPSYKTIALRADIDALPIIEKNKVSYKSKKEGVMHACGHDVHTSSLLGTAKILNKVKQNFEGTVKLIFQPGEERLPGGASLLIKEGVLDPYEQYQAPKSILGQHVMPFIPVGKVGFRSGMYMASADEIHFVVKGKGGHAAMPELLVDPVLITSHIIVALQQIISRNASPKIPSVLSFGKVNANGATNVIPNEVNVEGTFRTYDETWRADAHQKMKKMAETLAESMGATCEFTVKKGYPHLKNHPELTENAKNLAIDYLGEENVLDIDLWMAGEDFAYYSQEIDACFYRLGTRNESKGITSSVHTPTFDIDEDALEISTGLMAWMAINELKR